MDTRKSCWPRLFIHNQDCSEAHPTKPDSDSRISHFNTHASPPSCQSMLPDVTIPNHLTAQTPTPYTLPCLTPNLPETITSTNAEPSVVPPPSLSSEPNSLPKDLPLGSSALLVHQQ